MEMQLKADHHPINAQWDLTDPIHLNPQSLPPQSQITKQMKHQLNYTHHYLSVDLRCRHQKTLSHQHIRPLKFPLLQTGQRSQFDNEVKHKQ
jgi:hypothetical protein